MFVNTLMRHHSLNLLAGCAIALCLSSISNRADADELVTNGGFESSTYSGWTVVTQQTGSANIVTTIGDVHSGTYAAQFASVGQPFNSISQVLNTTSGTTYNISFWEQAGSGGGGNFGPGTQEFKALFNGVPLLDQVTTTGIAYTNYTFQATATSNSTTLEFDSQNNPDWNYLDNVSVSTVPEPSVGFMAACALVSIAIFYRRQPLQLSR